MTTASAEPWFNQALVYIGLAVLVPLAGLAAAHYVSQPAKMFNLYALRGQASTELFICGCVWMAVRLCACPQHYYFCNDSEVEYCYTFLLDLFAPLYLCLVFLSNFFNCANWYLSCSFLIILYSLYSLLPSPIVCWWTIVWSILTFLLQTWAMYGLAKDRRERVGLLHMNYVLTVHWMLGYFAYPPATAHTWGETQSFLRDWQYAIHALAAVAIGALVWWHSHPLPKTATDEDETPMQPPSNLP